MRETHLKQIINAQRHVFIDYKSFFLLYYIDLYTYLISTDNKHQGRATAAA